MEKRLSNFDLKSAYRKWHGAAGIFRCFVRASNFVSLKQYPDFEFVETFEGSDVLMERVMPALEAYKPHDTLLAVDLPDYQAIVIAVMLNCNWSIMPVLTFKGLLHPNGLVGTRHYISHLLESVRILEDKEPKGYAFIMDSNRFGDYGVEKLRSCFNNQYELNEEDLPSMEMLRELGYASMLYLHWGQVKEDMGAYIEYLQENGFPVHITEVGES